MHICMGKHTKYSHIFPIFLFSKQIYTYIMNWYAMRERQNGGWLYFTGTKHNVFKNIPPFSMC